MAAEIRRAYDFLKLFDVDHRAHSGRTLHEHLSGTEQILCRWHCAIDTRMAGLFHSIYGTNMYRHAAAALVERSKLGAVIGDKAEQLVFLFHSAERPAAFIDALYSNVICSRLDGQHLTLSRDELAKLIEIECANLIEQRRGGRFLRAVSLDEEFEDLNLSATMMREIRTLPASSDGDRE